MEDIGRGYRSPVGVGEGIGLVVGSPVAERRRRELGYRLVVAGRTEAGLAVDRRAGLGCSSPAAVEDSLGEERRRGLAGLEGGSRHRRVHHRSSRCLPCCEVARL